MPFSGTIGKYNVIRPFVVDFQLVSSLWPNFKFVVWTPEQRYVS